MFADACGNDTLSAALARCTQRIMLHCGVLDAVGAILTTAACALDLVSPFSLYFNWRLITQQFHVRGCASSCSAISMFRLRADLAARDQFLLLRAKVHARLLLPHVLPVSSCCVALEVCRVSTLHLTLQRAILPLLGRGLVPQPDRRLLLDGLLRGRVVNGAVLRSIVYSMLLFDFSS